MKEVVEDLHVTLTYSLSGSCCLHGTCCYHGDCFLGDALLQCNPVHTPATSEARASEIKEQTT